MHLQLGLTDRVSSSLSALWRLSSLTAVSFPFSGFSFPTAPEVASALRGFSGLQSLHIYYPPSPLEGLELLRELEHVQAVHFGPEVDSLGEKVERARPWQVSMVHKQQEVTEMYTKNCNAKEKLRRFEKLGKMP